MFKSPLAVIFLTITLDLIGFGMVLPLLPLYAEKFGANATWVAILFASYSFMQFVCAPLWGALSDRIGRRPVLLMSIGANVGAMALFGCARSYGWLLAARLLAGLCTANISVANAYVADITPPEQRARGMGMVGAAFGIGFVLGPFFGGELSQWGYAVPAFAAAALGALNLLLAAIRLHESLPPDKRRARQGSVWRERLSAFRDGRDLARLFALTFFQVSAFAMMETALVLFAARRLGVEARGSGRIFAFVGVVMVIVQGGLLGRLVRRFGETVLARAGLLLTAVGLGAMPFVPQGGWVPLLACMAFLGTGQGITSPSLSSLISRTASPHGQGGALGAAQSLSALARVVGPLTAGVLFDWGGENTPFWVGAALMIATWTCAMRWLRRLLPQRAVN